MSATGRKRIAEATRKRWAEFRAKKAAAQTGRQTPAPGSPECRTVAAEMSSPTGSLIPPAPGTYALILRCDTVRSIRIGRLGVLQLRPGYYVYVGSAFGSGGLRARIRHHQRMAQRPHWHIDYLRLHARLQSVCFCHGSRCEHEWAGRIGAMTGAKMVLRRFGSSDCECGTHLYWFEARPAVSVALAV